MEGEWFGYLHVTGYSGKPATGGMVAVTMDGKTEIYSRPQPGDMEAFTEWAKRAFAYESGYQRVSGEWADDVLWLQGHDEGGE